MASPSQNKNTNKVSKNQPLNSFINSLSSGDNDKISKKIQSDLTLDENIDGIADFGEQIAREVNMDWDNMSSEDQTKFTLDIFSYYTEFLKNFMQSIKDEELQNTMVLFIKSGFNEKIIETNEKLKSVIEMFNYNFINTVRQELISEI